MRTSHENRVYPAESLHTLAPNTNVTQNSYINLNRWEFRIKSIAFDLCIHNETLTQRVPPELATLVDWDFVVTGDPPPDTLIGYAYEDNLIPAAIGGTNGRNIHFKTPKQLIFDSFFSSNRLRFAFTLWNYDLVNTYTFGIVYITEVELLHHVI